MIPSDRFRIVPVMPGEIEGPTAVIPLGEALAENQRRYREDNKEKIAENKRRYYEDNKEKIAENKRRYREAKKARGGRA